MLAETLKIGFRSGYLRTSLLLNRVFNILLSLVLIVLCLPLFALISVLIFLRDGRPVIYRGLRLGQNKQPFTMYKFRTLVPEANKIIGPQLLSARHKLVTPLGKVLRDTRLDELPQLFNILKGDMDFLGPRPERPEIYESICRHIHGYDKRFLVKPGLLGFSQVFTPHSTPKRIRVFIDNRLVTKKQRIFWDAFEVLLTGLVVLRTTVARTSRYLYRDVFLSRILRRYDEKREFGRIRLKGNRILLLSSGSEKDAPVEGELIDINERAFLAGFDRRVSFPTNGSKDSSGTDPAPLIQIRLEAVFENGRGSGRRKIARCQGRLYRETKRSENRYDYVVMYEPDTPLNYYVVHQYFLRKSMAYYVRR